MTEAELEKIFPFKRHWFPLADIKLHYVDEGEGKPLVLFHACPYWSFSFREMIRKFSKDHRVIALDLPGFGLSQYSSIFDYTLSGYINVAEVFLESLDLKEMTLVLHGWGGTVGMGYAVLHPQRIKGLVIMNVLVSTSYRLPWQLEFCRLPLISRCESLILKLLQSGRVSRQSNEVRAAYNYPYQEKIRLSALVKFVKDIPNVPEAESAQRFMEIESGLWNFRTTPALILWATRDWLYPLGLLKKWMHYLPDAKVHRIRRAGHYIQEDASALLNQKINAFLTQNHL